LGEGEEIEYFTHGSGFTDLENKYMTMLEESYNRDRNVKQLKKVKIKASIRVIQRAWKRHFNCTKLRKVLTIQRWYRMA
jgi:hypothetical protein